MHSNVEAEVHHVTLLHHILLALQPQLPALARLLLAAGCHKLVKSNGLRADEPLLKVPGATRQPLLRAIATKTMLRLSIPRYPTEARMLQCTEVQASHNFRYSTKSARVNHASCLRRRHASTDCPCPRLLLACQGAAHAQSRKDDTCCWKEDGPYTACDKQMRCSCHGCAQPATGRWCRACSAWTAADGLAF